MLEPFILKVGDEYNGWKYGGNSAGSGLEEVLKFLHAKEENPTTHYHYFSRGYRSISVWNGQHAGIKYCLRLDVRGGKGDACPAELAVITTASFDPETSTFTPKS